MASFIVSYDLEDTNNPHSAFLAAAKKLGWTSWVPTNADNYYKLPNTTLSGHFTSLDAAVHAFEAIKPAAESALRKSIKVEKHFLTEYTLASVDSDDVSINEP